jgi:hypothetical protein
MLAQFFADTNIKDVKYVNLPCPLNFNVIVESYIQFQRGSSNIVYLCIFACYNHTTFLGSNCLVNVYFKSKP